VRKSPVVKEEEEEDERTKQFISFCRNLFSAHCACPLKLQMNCCVVVNRNETVCIQKKFREFITKQVQPGL
jgi:hypothetical protein